jgi:hypothetical protein
MRSLARIIAIGKQRGFPVTSLWPNIRILVCNEPWPRRRFTRGGFFKSRVYPLRTTRWWGRGNLYLTHYGSNGGTPFAEIYGAEL